MGVLILQIVDLYSDVWIHVCLEISPLFFVRLVNRSLNGRALDLPFGPTQLLFCISPSVSRRVEISPASQCFIWFNVSVKITLPSMCVCSARWPQHQCPYMSLLFVCEYNTIVLTMVYWLMFYCADMYIGYQVFCFYWHVWGHNSSWWPQPCAHYRGWRQCRRVVTWQWQSRRRFRKVCQVFVYTRTNVQCGWLGEGNNPLSVIWGPLPNINLLVGVYHQA